MGQEIETIIFPTVPGSRPDFSDRGSQSDIRRHLDGSRIKIKSSNERHG